MHPPAVKIVDKASRMSPIGFLRARVKVQNNHRWFSEELDLKWTVISYAEINE